METTPFFFNQCFEKKRVKKLILWSVRFQGEDKTLEMIEDLKQLGFHYATFAGVSLSIDDLAIPPKKRTELLESQTAILKTINGRARGYKTAVEQIQTVIDTWHRTSETVKDHMIEFFEATDVLNPVYMMAFSGARGNVSQVRQLVGMRGLVSDPKGDIIGYAIRSNFREGLTMTEYLISAYGARKGVVDTALRTADAGYLTRRLVDVAQHIIVKEGSCGTNRGINLKAIKTGQKTVLNLHDRLVGRVLAQDIEFEGEKIAFRNQAIDHDLANDIIKAVGDYKPDPFEKPVEKSPDKQQEKRFAKRPLAKRDAKHEERRVVKEQEALKANILVRSPLTCAIDGGVCQLCYGWSFSQNRLVSVGDVVGIMAGQSIGEPGTQLTMRTFHTGGVFTGEVQAEFRAPHGGIIHYPQSLPGVIVRTPYGQIAFLAKKAGSLIIRDGERKSEIPVPSHTALLLREGESIRDNQLLGLLREMEGEGNEKVETKKMVFSEFDGEIGYENVMLKSVAFPETLKDYVRRVLKEMDEAEKDEKARLKGRKRKKKQPPPITQPFHIERDKDLFKRKRRPTFTVKMGNIWLFAGRQLNNIALPIFQQPGHLVHPSTVQNRAVISTPTEGFIRHEGHTEGRTEVIAQTAFLEPVTAPSTPLVKMLTIPTAFRLSQEAQEIDESIIIQTVEEAESLSGDMAAIYQPRLHMTSATVSIDPFENQITIGSLTGDRIVIPGYAEKINPKYPTHQINYFFPPEPPRGIKPWLLEEALENVVMPSQFVENFEDDDFEDESLYDHFRYQGLEEQDIKGPDMMLYQDFEDSDCEDEGIEDQGLQYRDRTNEEIEDESVENLSFEGEEMENEDSESENGIEDLPSEDIGIERFAIENEYSDIDVIEEDFDVETEYLEKGKRREQNSSDKIKGLKGYGRREGFQERSMGQQKLDLFYFSSDFQFRDSDGFMWHEDDEIHVDHQQGLLLVTPYTLRSLENRHAALQAHGNFSSSLASTFSDNQQGRTLAKTIWVGSSDQFSLQDNLQGHQNPRATSTKASLWRLWRHPADELPEEIKKDVLTIPILKETTDISENNPRSQRSIAQIQVDTVKDEINDNTIESLTSGQDQGSASESASLEEVVVASASEENEDCVESEYEDEGKEDMLIENVNFPFHEAPKHVQNGILEEVPGWVYLSSLNEYRGKKNSRALRSEVKEEFLPSSEVDFPGQRVTCTSFVMTMECPAKLPSYDKTVESLTQIVTNKAINQSVVLEEEAHRDLADIRLVSALRYPQFIGLLTKEPSVVKELFLGSIVISYPQERHSPIFGLETALMKSFNMKRHGRLIKGSLLSIYQSLWSASKTFSKRSISTQVTKSTTPETTTKRSKTGQTSKVGMKGTKSLQAQAKKSKTGVKGKRSTSPFKLRTMSSVGSFDGLVTYIPSDHGGGHLTCFALLYQGIMEFSLDRLSSTVNQLAHTQNFELTPILDQHIIEPPLEMRKLTPQTSFSAAFQTPDLQGDIQERPSVSITKSTTLGYWTKQHVSRLLSSLQSKISWKEKQTLQLMVLPDQSYIPRWGFLCRLFLRYTTLVNGQQTGVWKLGWTPPWEKETQMGLSMTLSLVRPLPLATKDDEVFYPTSTWLMYGDPFSRRRRSINSTGEIFHAANNTTLVLDKRHIFTFDLSEWAGKITTSVGTVLRFGDQIGHGLGSSMTGQVIAMTPTTLWIREVQPILFYPDGVIYVQNGECIGQDRPLVELTYQRFVTGDIVQGIAKIEQLFEGSQAKDQKTGIKLNRFLLKRYRRRRKKVSDDEKVSDYEAFYECIEIVREKLIESIQKIYLSQGVTIPDIHFEVIVRRMTSWGRIRVPGDSGFFRDEIVSYYRIEKVNAGLLHKRALCNPLIVGISAAALNAESFLSAASFQETARVLARDAMNGQIDFLRGVKERVILGDLIPGGTGIMDYSEFDQKPFTIPLTKAKRAVLNTFVAKEWQKQVKAEEESKISLKERRYCLGSNMVQIPEVPRGFHLWGQEIRETAEKVIKITQLVPLEIRTDFWDETELGPEFEFWRRHHLGLVPIIEVWDIVSSNVPGIQANKRFIYEKTWFYANALKMSKTTPFSFSPSKGKYFVDLLWDEENVRTKKFPKGKDAQKSRPKDTRKAISTNRKKIDMT